MKVHANAALGPAGRLALVQAIESGMTLRAAAAALNVAPATAHRWWHRWRLADESGAPIRRLAAGSLLAPPPPAAAPQRRRGGADPARSPADQPRPRPPGGDLPRAPLDDLEGALHATASPSAAARPRETYRRYEWSQPGALLHVDVARLARFNRPGHAVTGVRDMTGAEKRAGVGYVYLHCVIDDHCRYAYVEQHPDQGGDTAAAVLGRAIEHFAALGLKAPEAVMSDNAFAYRKSNAFRAVLERHGARHILTPPYTPRWNGKVERFIQTLKREWAYAHSWPNSAERTRAMASFLRYYNRRRPHSSLGDRPPISRVHNVRG